MTSGFRDDISVGKYRGRVAENWRFPEFLSWAEDMDKLVAAASADGADGGPARNRNVRLVFSRGGTSVALAAKAFGRQPAIKDWMDGLKGSRARRSWMAASYLRDHGIGTPAPAGFLERWEGGRLAESYFLTEYQEQVTSFKDELIRLFHDDPVCEKFMALIQCVAEAVRAMHEAGFLHNDLGNQNILLKRLDGKRWGGVQFIDLNRARIREPMSIGARARDISRIYLPSDFMRIFEDMYYGDVVPPHKFRESQRFSRRLYAWHANTRKWRHPIRTAKIRAAEKGRRSYPSEKDMWVWDWRSGQAINVMRPKDRGRYYSRRHFLQILKVTGTGFLPTWRRYEELLEGAYLAPVAMKDRVGMTLNVNAATLDRELEALRKLGRLPVMVRFHQHDPSDAWSFAARAVRDLHREGYPVSIALVQDRRSVTEPDRWRSFVTTVLEQVHGAVEWVEVGHAINRVKWGVWDLGEHRRLMDVMVEVAKRFPDVKFMGPAVIDYEYLHLMAALRNLPPTWRFGALSHLLYVDRRGAPESQQGMFAALDKFAQAKAVALWSGVCGDRVIVSEVNWPLKGTGVFSPVGAPHESPGPRHDDPSVSEDEYGDYMLRYLLIAICSGLIDRVYWWRLAARGFGLVDDTDERRWRERPAYHMLKTFLATLGECVFQQKPDAREGLAARDLPRAEGVHLFVFRRPDGGKAAVAYSSSGPLDLVLPFEYREIRDAFGKPLAASPDRRTVSLSGRPVYVFAP